MVVAAASYIKKLFVTAQELIVSFSIIKLSIVSVFITLTSETATLLINDIFSENINYLANNYIIKDYFITFVKILLWITGLCILNSSKNFILTTKNSIQEYGVLFVFSLFFLGLLIYCFTLISFFIAILGASILLYSLIGLNKITHGSREALLKYFILSALASGLLSYSIIGFYSIISNINFFWINTSLSLWYLYSNNLNENLIGCVTFLCLAVFFKLSAFPGNLWVVDIYQGVSNPITATFIMPVKIPVFFSFSRIITWVLDSVKNIWGFVLWISSIVSMFWGALGSLIEQSFKKLLSYASVNQMGYFLIGLSCLTFSGTLASHLYINIYMITNIALFAIFLNTKEISSNFCLKYLNEFNSFAKENGFLSILICIILFSMAGIPPLAGFFGKMFLFIKAFETHVFSLIISGIITSLISTFYYLNLINKMWFLFLHNCSFFVCKFPQLIQKLIQLAIIYIVFFPITDYISKLLENNQSYFIA